MDDVRATCHLALSSSPHVAVDGTAIEALAARLVASPPAALASAPAPTALPLAWASEAEEVGTCLLLQLLNFGSGWRVLLHAREGGTGGGAWDTVLRGVVAAHIGGARLWSASGACGADGASVAAAFGLPLTEDRPLPDAPAIRMEAPAATAPLARLIARALAEAGAALRNRGAEDLAAWLAAGAAAEAAAAGAAGAADDWRPSAAALVARLAAAFPPFRDEQPLRRSPATSVRVLKKAQLAAAHLHRRFATRLPRQFGFRDVAALTVAADNVLPAVLRAEGVLKLAPALAASIDAGRTLPPGDDELDLRAAPVVAGQRLCESIRRRAAAAAAVEAAAAAAPDGGGERAAVLARLADLCEADLDEYLWLRGKEPGMRELPRHACKKTYFY